MDSGLHTALIVLGTIIFVACQPTAILLSALTLPGSLLVLASAGAYSIATGWQRPSIFVLIVLLAMSLTAEFLDNVLSMFGVKRFGGSRRTAIAAGLGALGGAMVGGSVFGALGLAALVAGPIGWAIGVVLPPLLGAAIGGFAVAYLVELRSGKDREDAAKAGWGAVVGRVMGIVAKVVITTMMAIIALVAVFWHM